jgi:hypothetical protein
MYEFTYRNSTMGLGMTGMFMTALSAQWKEPCIVRLLQNILTEILDKIIQSTKRYIKTWCIKDIATLQLYL